MKKGQISVFIIIGLIFLALITLLSQMSFQPKNPETQDTLTKTVVNTCLRNIVDDRIDSGFDFLPMQIMNDLPSCARHALEAEVGHPDISLFVADNQLEIDAVMPIAISAGNRVTREKEFHLSYPLYSMIYPSQNVLRSPDGKVTLRIEPGTVITGPDGEPVEKLYIFIKKGALPNNLDNVVYAIAPDVVFSKPAMLNFKYDNEELSGVIVGDGLDLARPNSYNLRMATGDDLSLAQLIPAKKIQDSVYTNQKIISSSVIKSQKTVAGEINHGGIYLLVPNKLHVAVAERSLYTTNAMERASAISDGYKDLGVVGYLKSSGDLPVYSYFTGPYQNNYLTTNTHELDMLESVFEPKGIVGYLDLEDGPGKTALYRLNNPIADYRYTTSDVEKEKALAYMQSMLGQVLSPSDSQKIIENLDNREEAINVVDIDFSDIDLNELEYYPYFYDGLMGYIYTAPEPGSKALHELFYSKQVISIPYNGYIYSSFYDRATMPVTGFVALSAIGKGIENGIKGASATGSAIKGFAQHAVPIGLAITAVTHIADHVSAYAMEHTEQGTISHSIAKGVNSVTSTTIGLVNNVERGIANTITSIVGVIANAQSISATSEDSTAFGNADDGETGANMGASDNGGFGDADDGETGANMAGDSGSNGADSGGIDGSPDAVGGVD